MHKNKQIRFKVFVTCLFASVVVLSLLSFFAFNEAKASGEEGVREVNEQTPVAEYVNDSDSTKKKTDGHVFNLANRYYSSELRMTSDKITKFDCPNNELELVGYMKANKSGKYWNHTDNDGWYDTGGLEEDKKGSFYYDGAKREWLTVNKDKVSYTIPANNSVTIGKKDQQDAVATISFSDVGEVEVSAEKKVKLDAELKIHSIILTNEDSSDATIFNGEDGLYPVASIRNYNMQDVLNDPQKKKNIYDLPQIAGPISFTTENHVYSSQKKFTPKVEIDYSMTIYDSKDHSKTFEYPVYSMYTDLDVVKPKSTGQTHPESITPAAGDNHVDFVGRYKPKSADDQQIEDRYGLVREGRSTFTTIKDMNTGGFPDSLVKGGITLTSNSGTYRAIWRGGGCETGITLAPLGYFHAFKSDQYDLVEQKDFKDSESQVVTFDVEAYLGRWSEDTFLNYDNIDFVDKLPPGMTLKNGVADIEFGYKWYNKDGSPEQDFVSFKSDEADTKQHKGPKDKSGQGYIQKLEYNSETKEIHLRMDRNFLQYDNDETDMLKRYDGKTLCMRINAVIDDIDKGEESEYPEKNIYSYKHDVYKDRYKEKPAIKFSNIGTVWCDSTTDDYQDGFPQNTNEVDAYSPYYSKVHNFYECDKDGNYDPDNLKPLDDYVKKEIFDKNADTMQQEHKYEYKLNSEVSVDTFSSSKDDTGKRVIINKDGHDEVWCFKKWDKEKQYCTKENLQGTAMLGRELVFNGFWFKVNTPDNKEWKVSSGSKPVKVGDTIDYAITATNSVETANSIKVEDYLSQGLTFNEPTIEVYKDGERTTDFTYDISTDTEKNTVVTYNFNNVGYGDKIVINYNATVNEKAEIVGEFPVVANTVKIEIDKYTKTIVNPVMFKTYGEQEDKMIADSSPVHVGDMIKYRIYWAGYTDKSTDKILVSDTLSKGLVYDHVAIGNPSPTFDPDNPQHLTWKFENVDVGAHDYIEIYAKVTDEALQIESKTVSNKYSVTIDNLPAIEPKSVENPVVAKRYDANAKDGQINNDSPVKYDDTIAYQLDWAAYQYEDAKKIVLEDTLSKGLTYVGTTTEGIEPVIKVNEDGTTTVTYTLTDKPAGSQGSICFTAKVNKDAVAEVVDKDKYNVENNYSLHIDDKPVIKVDPLDNPVVAKAYNPKDTQATINDDQPVKYNDVIGYKIDWANSYATATDNIIVTDTLSKGLEFDPDSASPAATAYSTDIETGVTTITWNLGAQEAKATGVITYRAKVTEKAIQHIPDKVVNTASIAIDKGRSIDLDPLTNPVVAKKYNEEDREATCTAKGPVTLDSVIGYELNWAAYENKDAKQIVLADKLSKGLTYVKTTTEGIEPVVTVNEDGTTDVTYTLTDIPAASTGKICFEAKVNKDAIDELIDNEYYVVQNDYKLLIDAKTIELEPLKNPVIHKTYGAPEEGVVNDTRPVKVGDIISYKVYWSALPNEDCERVEVLDEMKKGLEYIGVGEGTPEPTYVTKDPDIACWIFTEGDNIKAGAHGVFELKAKVTADALLTKDEQVENDYSIHVFDGAWCDAKPVINPVISKQYDKEGKGITDDSPVKVGDEICYRLHWANTTDKQANVKVHDVMSKGLEYVDGSSEPTVSSDKRELTWDLGLQEPGAKGTFTYRAKVTNDAVVDLPYRLVNKYTLDIENVGTFELDPLENPVVAKQYNLDDKDANIHNNAQVREDDLIGYKICWANNISTDGTVTIKDVLSKGLEFDRNSVQGIDVIPSVDKQTDGSTIVTWVLKDMPAGSSGVFSYRAKVNKEAMTVDPGTVVNTASVAVDGGRTIELDPLINPTPANPVQTLATGDYNMLIAIALFIIVCVSGIVLKKQH